jgi:hypothetical protein
VSGDRYQGHVFDPAALAEAGDLTTDRRKEILFAEARLPGWTHWEVLGLPWNAPVEAVRAAYIDRVKIFHPDQYPGKQRNAQRLEYAGCKGRGRTDDCNLAAISACLEEQLQGGVDERGCRNYGNAA